MKVQIFPKISSLPSPPISTFIKVGALTFKPLAFQFRPWELTATTVFNHLEGTGNLVFHVRGTRVQKITSSTWLQDQTRFMYDGFRRQRLTSPLVRGVSVGWPIAVAAWLTVVGRSCSFTFKIDPVSGSRFFWWTRLYHATGHPNDYPTLVAVDTAVATPVIYHGGFGLPGAAAALVVLPAGLPYEDDQVLVGPVGVPVNLPTAVAQLFGGCTSYQPSVWPTPGEATPRTKTCTLLQVSPLQRLLQGW